MLHFWIKIWHSQRGGTMRCFAKSLTITINMPYNMAFSHATTNIMDLPHTSHLLPGRPINSHIKSSLLSFYVHWNFHAHGPTAAVTPPIFMQTVPCFHFPVSFFANASTPEVIISCAIDYHTNCASIFCGVNFHATGVAPHRLLWCFVNCHAVWAQISAYPTFNAPSSTVTQSCYKLFILGACFVLRFFEKRYWRELQIKTKSLPTLNEAQKTHVQLSCLDSLDPACWHQQDAFFTFAMGLIDSASPLQHYANES